MQKAQHRDDGFLRSIQIGAISVALIVLSSLSALAESLTLTTYYPAPQGAYDRVTLLPQVLSTPCALGTLSVKQRTDQLHYCFDDGSGNGQWTLLESSWTQSGNDVFPTAIVTNPNIFVGIGTTVPEFKLTLENDGGILAMGQLGSGQLLPDLPAIAESSFEGAVQMIWYPRKAAFRVGHLTHFWGEEDFSDAWNDGNIGDYSIALGKDNIKASGLAAVAFGRYSKASGDYSANLGGLKTDVFSQYAVNWGERSDVQGRASVVGGESSQTRNDYNVVFSGSCNVAAGVGATITGGSSNNAQWVFPNCLTDPTKTVAADYFTISGGTLHHDPGIYSVVSGGYQNSAGPYAVVGGGQSNNALASYSFIAGGLTNTANGLYSVIDGGRSNTVNGSWSAIMGGTGNVTSGDYAVIWGGANNRAGRSSIVVGGVNNDVSGNYSVISNGRNNTVLGDYSWAGGRYMNLINSANRSFVWGYSISAVSISASDAFIIAPGNNNPKVGIRNTAPSAILDIKVNNGDDFLAVTSQNSATAGDIFMVKNNGRIGVGRPDPAYPLHFGNNAHLDDVGTWMTLSSREYKEHIYPLDTRQALEVVKELQPVTYNYKVNHEEHHVGFIAEDVPEFVAEEGRRSVDPMGITAVLTGALKEQNNQMRLQDQTFEKIELQLQTLEKKLQHRP